MRKKYPERQRRGQTHRQWVTDGGDTKEKGGVDKKSEKQTGVEVETTSRKRKTDGGQRGRAAQGMRPDSRQDPLNVGSRPHARPGAAGPPGLGLHSARARLSPRCRPLPTQASLPGPGPGGRCEQRRGRPPPARPPGSAIAIPVAMRTRRRWRAPHSPARRVLFCVYFF